MTPPHHHQLQNMHFFHFHLFCCDVLCVYYYLPAEIFIMQLKWKVFQRHSYKFATNFLFRRRLMSCKSVMMMRDERKKLELKHSQKKHWPSFTLTLLRNQRDVVGFFFFTYSFFFVEWQRKGEWRRRKKRSNCETKMPFTSPKPVKMH